MFSNMEEPSALQDRIQALQQQLESVQKKSQELSTRQSTDHTFTPFNLSKPSTNITKRPLEEPQEPHEPQELMEFQDSQAPPDLAGPAPVQDSSNEFHSPEPNESYSQYPHMQYQAYPQHAIYPLVA